ITPVTLFPYTTLFRSIYDLQINLILGGREMNTDKLVELFREEVEKLEKEAYERGKRDAFEKSIEEPVQPLSANQQRKELIERAGEFVEEHTTEISRKMAYLNSFVPLVREKGNLTAKFIVNAEKRTVVALIHLSYSGGVASRGIAKCHPDEVFNADIGKAIALARALE